MSNKEFFDYLIETAEKLRVPHQNDKGLWTTGKHIGTKHEPVNHNVGFRFDYPFNELRFDSVDGWQQHKRMCGWQNVEESSTVVIKARLHFGLPKYEPTDEEAKYYNYQYERIVGSLDREAQRKREITDAWNAVKDLRPMPATIENITAMLHYFKMEGCVGELVPMTIGYSCNDYDCDGKYAVAMKLDKPIVVNEEGETSDRIVCGAPRGHLTKYYRV